MQVTNFKTPQYNWTPDSMLEVTLKDTVEAVEKELSRFLEVTGRLAGNKIYHLLEKDNRYFITHYKELRRLDGLPDEGYISKGLMKGRNQVAILLEDWGMLTIVDNSTIYHSYEFVLKHFSVVSKRNLVDFTVNTPYLGT